MPVHKPMSYYGGKTALAGAIASQFPAHMDAYIEPFAGSASVFFAAPGRWADIEILNDLNGDLIAFYKALRDHTAETIRRLSLTPFSRQVYNEARQALIDQTYQDEIDRGLSFFITVFQSFSNTGKVNAWLLPTIDNRAALWSKGTAEAALMAVALRLREANIENYPALKVLDLYDRPGALFYIDPPYLSVGSPRDKAVVYRGLDMAEDAHAQLLDRVARLKGYALISGYDHPLYATLTNHGWDRVDIAHRTAINFKSTTKTSARTEVIWINPRLAENRKIRRLF